MKVHIKLVSFLISSSRTQARARGMSKQQARNSALLGHIRRYTNLLNRGFPHLCLFDSGLYENYEKPAKWRGGAWAGTRGHNPALTGVRWRVVVYGGVW
jgi:hypothetical protein